MLAAIMLLKEERGEDGDNGEAIFHHGSVFSAVMVAYHQRIPSRERSEAHGRIS